MLAAHLHVQEPEGVDDGERHQHDGGDADRPAPTCARNEHGSPAVDGARPRAVDVDVGTVHAGESVVRRRDGCTVGAMADDPLPPLDPATVDPEPMEQFARWYDAAVVATGDRAAAMTVATATPDGRPSARVVLLRGFDARGLVFFTNYDSRKGGELAANAAAAAVLYWGELDAQIRSRVGSSGWIAEESDAYFAQRPRGHQIGAWASHQSAPVADRATLEAQVVAAEAQYPGRRPAAAALGRVPDRPGDGRVLAQPGRPRPRPRRVHTARRRVAHPPPQSVTIGAVGGLGRRRSVLPAVAPIARRCGPRGTGATRHLSWHGARARHGAARRGRSERSRQLDRRRARLDRSGSTSASP